MLADLETEAPGDSRAWQLQLVRLPEPNATAEAFAALLARRRTAPDDTRYFVLEATREHGPGPPEAYLVEYRRHPSGTLRIRGVDLPDPDLEVFVNLCRREPRDLPDPRRLQVALAVGLLGQGLAGLFLVVASL